MKKTLSLIVSLIFFPLQALATFPSGTTWELRGNGSDTNGGGFVIGLLSKSTATDLAVNASDPKKVSSSTYGFTSADIGRFIKTTAGTGFTANALFGPITAVSGGLATVDRAVAAVGTTGGSVTVYYGKDYSQSNSPNSNGGTNGSSVLAVTNGTTTITCADCSFTQDIVGNYIYLSGGTGSLAATRREVSSYTNSTTIVVDASVAASTGVTLNVGGALGSFAEILSARGIVANNKIWWKNDTGISTNTALSTSIGGAEIIGYNTTRGDIVVAGLTRPTLTFTGTGAYALTTSSGTWRLSNFTIDSSSGSGANGYTSTGGSAALYNVTTKNYDGIGINFAGTGALCMACEATGGTSNATVGIKLASGGDAIGSYVHDGAGVGIQTVSGGALIGNIVDTQSGASSDCYQVAGTGVVTVIGNVGYNCGRHGTNFTGAVIVIAHQNNIYMSNGGFGAALSSAVQARALYDGNAYYNNTSGTRSNFDAATLSTQVNPAYTNPQDIILTGSPFVDAPNADFRPNTTAGAGAAVRDSGQPRSWPGLSFTGYPDVGAASHQDPGVVVINPSFGF